MLAKSSPLLLALAVASALAQRNSSTATRPRYIPDTYIVQLKDVASVDSLGDGTPPHESFAKRAAEEDVTYDVNREYKDSSLFYGLSITVHNNESLAVLEALPEVMNISPVVFIPRPEAGMGPVSAEALQGIPRSSAVDEGLVKRELAGSRKLNYNSPHKMTGVDRLHRAGIKGKGAKIAIIDSGIDYNHPALGGCFGSGCKISSGYDFVGDDYDGWNSPVEDDDPLATCAGGGHGTHVAGIIGMDSGRDTEPFPGMIGVAPEATLSMYRVFGCDGGAGSDVLVAAIIRAATDGADLITMSIGMISAVGNSPQDPFHVLIQRLKDRGIPVLAAAGNDGAVEPFTINAPANSPAAIAVGSVENTLFQTFEAEDSNGDVIRYGSVYPFPASKTLKAVHVGDGTTVADFGCRVDNYNRTLDKVGSGDREDYVVVVKRGLCGLAQIQASAAAAGFRNVMTYPDTEVLNNPFLLGYAAAIPTTDKEGVPLNFGTTTEDTIAVGSRKGGYSLRFKHSTPKLTKQTWGGQMNNFSSAGPVWDFSLKPQIAAPGGQILSTWPVSERGWAIVSGTSMACPYLAGIVALLKSQFPDFSVSQIVDRLQTTAKPTIRATRDDVSPPVHQGAGLVSAYAAVRYPSFVSPGQLELGPNEMLASVRHSITVTNPGKKPTRYTLSHNPAPGMARFPHPDVPRQQGFYHPMYTRLASLPFGATVRFPTGSTFTLAAGQSRKIPLDIQPPQDLEAFTIPFYSGYITITSNRNERFSVPYQGAGYNYAKAQTLGLDPVGPSVRESTETYPVFGRPALFDPDGNVMGNYTKIDPTEVGLLYSKMQPVRIERMDLVPAHTDFRPTYYGFDPDLPVNYTRTKQPINGTVAGAEISGNLYVNLDFAPTISTIDMWPVPRLWDVTGLVPISMLKGGYRLLISHLKYGDYDEDKSEDWTTWLSGVIDVPEDYII